MHNYNGYFSDGALAQSTASAKIVFGHHQIYAGGHYGPNLHLIGMLTPIFESTSVKVYINGHEHHFERTHCIEGTTYLTCGAESAALRYADKAPWSAHAESRFSFCVAYEVFGKQGSQTPEYLKIKAIDAQNQAFDETVVPL